MLLVIAFIFVVCVIVGTFAVLWETVDPDGTIGVAFVFSAIVSILAVFMVCSARVQYEPWNHSESITKIVTVQDGIANQGRFSLGSGYVDGNLKYFFYVPEGNGFKAGGLNSKDVTVIEDQEPGTAYIKYAKDSRSFGNFWINGYWEDSRSYQEIHVPKDTIIKNMTLDAK